ncbi:MAG TPA: GGDEF domain-containing protein [Myxococcota bacterium]
MAFWNKRDTSAAVTALTPPRDATRFDVVADDAALEALGALLRRLGDGDADDERQHLEAWAHHVLLQGPVPTNGQRLPPGRRDWRGLRAAVDDILSRRRERSGRAIGDLRETVGAMTRTLVRMVSEDKGADDVTRDELARLKLAADTRPPEEIKRTALAVVASLTVVLGERAARQEKRLAELQARADGLEGKLQLATKEKLEDALTGLVNRRGFDIELARAVEARRLRGDDCSLILFDLDHFKQLNDTWGHPGGDIALKAFARTLSLSFPRRDDCVARFGGEEFVVLLRGARAEDALRLAERCLDRQRLGSIDVGGGTIVVTASAGVTDLREDDDDALFVARADAALYRAKRSGRDRAVLAI